MTSVLLATFALMPEGEPDGHHLTAALAARGIDSTWVRWDDPAVDWAAADIVAVRATWDYQRRCAEFLDWARATERVSRLLNGAEVFAWNADKAYLTELAAVVDVVPTGLLDNDTLVSGLQAAVDRWGTTVIKPRTGAGGVGVVIAESIEDERLVGLTEAPWIVQPLVESVRTTGETSVYVLGGRAVSQVDKSTGGDEIRVHEYHGGSSRAGRPRRRAGGPRRGRRAGRGDPPRRRPPLRPRRHDGLGGPLGGLRARADRARPLPRHRPRQRRPFRGSRSFSSC